MYQHNTLDHFNPSKISTEFASRLSHLQPQQTVRVLVMLQLDNAGKKAEARQSLADRKATIEAVRNCAKQRLCYIRKIIQEFGGRQLADYPNALGTIPIEISAAGVSALTESDAVKAVMEEQAIYPGDGIESFF